MLITGAPTDIAGRVVYPDDAKWDGSRRAFNLAIDQRPIAVAFPADDRDVAALVGLARERGLRIAAQATGPNASFVEKRADAQEFFDVDTWARLRKVKAQYDADDTFQANHHVPPA